MPVTTPTRRPPVAARRFGYLVTVSLNAVFLYLLNVSPGWDAVPFLTSSTALVVGLVNVSSAIGIVINVSYMFYDPPWWRAAGETVTTAVGLAVLVRLWDVFPFDFAESSVNWSLVTRVVLVIAIAGSVIGIVVQLLTLARQLLR